MKHTVHLTNNNIVERVDLRTAETLVINCGWRTSYEAKEHLVKVAEMLKEKGFTPKLVEDHSLRHGGVIIGPIFYRLCWREGQSAMAYGARVCKHFQNAVSGILLWCMDNCEVEPVLDKDRLHFFTDDDFMLYTMRFGGKAQEG